MAGSSALSSYKITFSRLEAKLSDPTENFNPGLSTMNYPTLDISTPDFSTMNFSTPDFPTQSVGLKIPGMESSWLKSPGLKGLGVKLGVEKSGV